MVGNRIPIADLVTAGSGQTDFHLDWRIALARDPDPKSGQALVEAATQKGKWVVRAAAFDAIARRNDPPLLRAAVDGLQDKQDEVQYTAAGAVIHLPDIQAGRVAVPKAAPAKKKTPRSTL